MASYIEKACSTPEGSRSIRQEEFILEVTEKICRLMKQEGISRKELAQRMGRSKGRITQLLDGEANITLRTLSDISAALCRKIIMDWEKHDGSITELLPYRETVRNPWKLSSELPSDWDKDEVSLFQTETFDSALAG